MINHIYKPVSCDLVDQIEIKATFKEIVEIKYYSLNRTAIFSFKTKIKSWKTLNKVEYLVTNNDDLIRLDRIIQFGTFMNNNSCEI